MDQCLFCKILKGTVPCAKVFEDAHTFAFLDINPVQKGHTLVIPKKHADNLFLIEPLELQKVIAAVQKVAKAVKSGVEAEGINLIQSNHLAAGQSIDHIHFHVIPRFPNDGLQHWPQGKYAEGQMDVVRERIAKLL